MLLMVYTWNGHTFLKLKVVERFNWRSKKYRFIFGKGPTLISYIWLHYKKHRGTLALNIYLFYCIAKFEHPGLTVSAAYVENRIKPENHCFKILYMIHVGIEVIIMFTLKTLYTQNQYILNLLHHLRKPLSPGSRGCPLSSAWAPQTNLMFE